jgi:hypothetical protein
MVRLLTYVFYPDPHLIKLTALGHRVLIHGGPSGVAPDLCQSIYPAFPVYLGARWGNTAVSDHRFFNASDNYHRRRGQPDSLPILESIVSPRRTLNRCLWLRSAE